MIGGVTATGRRFVVALAVASLVPFVLAPVAQVSGVRADSGPWLLILALLGVAHVGTTAAFYVDRDARPLLTADPFRFFVLPAIAVAVGAGIAVASPARVFTYALVAFISWQLHHFTRQNLGCFAFVTKARGDAGPTGLERRALDLSTVAAVLATPMAIDASIPGAEVLRVVGFAVWTVAAVCWWRCPGDPVRRIALGFGVVFYLPLFLFDPGSMAVLGYALAHGAQYLLMMERVAKVDLRVVVGLAAGWLILGQWLHDVIGGSVQNAALGAAYGLVAAHFVIDAGIWKMRRPEQRAYMGRRFPFLAPSKQPVTSG